MLLISFLRRKTRAINIAINIKEIFMKKDFIFAPILLVIGVLLFLLRATGITAHIIISVIGILTLVAYTVLTKKEWKIPALEIAMRACYGIAIISGIIIMINSIAALAVIHKIAALIFLVLLVLTVAHKAITSKKA